MSGKPLPTVVVVDDSPTIRTLFERGTENLDVDLQIFDSASASWEFLKDTKPAMVFLNIKMPGKDGLTFLKEIKALPLHNDTSVVIISSKDYMQDRTVAHELGAAEFITKPMPIQTITDVVLKYTKIDPKI